MAQGTKEVAVKKVETTEVVRNGLQIVIPETMTLDAAINALNIQRLNDEKVIEIQEDIDTFLWDGAHAFYKAMREIYGFVEEKTIPGGMFKPDRKPAMVQIETAFGETTSVPFGRFELPNVENWVEMGYNLKDGRVIFHVTAQVKKKYEKQIRALLAKTREILKKESLYKGKAFKIKFTDGEGDRDMMAQPSFFDLEGVREHEIVFADEVQQAIATSLYAPVERSEECRKAGIPLKRGVLLTGPYGTGKTLAAYVTAKKCARNGWTFIYCASTDELAECVKLAQQYQPAAIFCEDIDRVVQGERTLEMDAILNIIDGVDSKNSEVMVVLTTNHVEDINKALLRPGRLDAVINVLPPDANAVVRLVRLYGRGLIDPQEDLLAVGMELQGNIPAVIRECVERSKLAAIRMAEPGGDFKITGPALLEAAKGMKGQLDLLNQKPKDERTDIEMFGDCIGKHIQDGINATRQKAVTLKLK